jgi:heptaprenyl diphosphate synthase
MTRLAIPGLEAADALLRGEIGARLDEVEEALSKAVKTDSELLGETASYLLEAGGKRYRPMLVMLSSYFGDPGDTRLVSGAVVVELTHLATLYHDDVIDEADARRGRPSVNTRWDNTVAILTGDYLFARASELSADLGTEVTRLMARTIATVCDGQIREVAVTGRVDQTVEAYTVAIRNKTAALTAASTRMGGLLSDAPEESLDTLEALGESVGMAFQLSDDIMDIVSTPEVLGKEPGVDIKEGIYTLPVLIALSDREGGAELRSLLTEGPPHGDDLARALDLVRADGAIDAARAAVTTEVRKAHAFLEQLPESRATEAFGQVADFLATRCGASV